MSSSTSNPVVVVGGTGLVGRHILTTLLTNPSTLSPIHTFSRRPLNLPETLLTSSTLIPHIEKDTSLWTSRLSSLTPRLLISSLGTTRGKAGSLAAQRAIDLDLNLSLAQAAKAAGVECYVLISTNGANSGSIVPYTKMKGELEDAVKALEFKHTVIVRPGLIVGEREESRMAEAVARKFAVWAGALSNAAKDFWAQDADVIARAAIRAGEKALSGESGNGKEGLWVLEQADIVKLGKNV